MLWLPYAKASNAFLVAILKAFSSTIRSSASFSCRLICVKISLIFDYSSWLRRMMTSSSFSYWTEDFPRFCSVFQSIITSLLILHKLLPPIILEGQNDSFEISKPLLLSTSIKCLAKSPLIVMLKTKSSTWRVSFSFHNCSDAISATLLKRNRAGRGYVF